MGWDYALVHVKFTIPPAVALVFVYRPLLTRLDAYKIVFLILIAVLSTIPWDSWLIKHRIWIYPADAIVGPTLLKIPAEELFFFIIQTFNTSLIYLLVNKPTFHPAYLDAERISTATTYKVAGQVILGLIIRHGFTMVRTGGEATYMGLILIWACPFLFILWSFAYHFLIGLPAKNIWLPIALPTAYLWFVDTLALQRGTWVIESGTKYNIQLWKGLEVEEAMFFLLTNTLIVFGLVAFDNALAVLHMFPEFFPKHQSLPSPAVLLRALLWPVNRYDERRIAALVDAISRLKAKSRSFYLASGTFEGTLRIDLVLLYSFCRAADDLIDEATFAEEAKVWITKLKGFIEIAFESPDNRSSSTDLRDFVKSEFPEDIHLVLLELPTKRLLRQPLLDLMRGFEMDVTFDEEGSQFPIATSNRLDLYGRLVAGTVAELCIHLILYHSAEKSSDERRRRLIHAGREMGIALQYVNIGRDIKKDAAMGRVYIPSTWLKEENLTPEEVIKDPSGPKVERLRQRLLDRAFEIYEGARKAIDDLPVEGRGPIRVAIESYMEIGRQMRQPGYKVRAGRATVPLLRRIAVAWAALSKN